MILKIQQIQFDAMSGDFNSRVEKAVSLLDSIRDANLVCLPELWATGFLNFEDFPKTAQKIDGVLVQQMCEIAKTKNYYLSMGSFIEKKEGKLYNTSVFISPSGEILSCYRKMHLFTYKSREPEFLSPGESLEILDTDFGKIGFATCYDLRFPEFFRKLIDQGAEIFIVPAAWPYPRLKHYHLFNQSRAVENLSLMISTNCVGSDGNLQLGGGSQAIGPFGEILQEGKQEEEILYTNFNTLEIQDCRNRFSALTDRRIKTS